VRRFIEENMPVLNHILKVGVIVPVHGTLDIETSREYRTFVGANQVAKTGFSKDVVEPNPTLGFMSADRDFI
jgi:hypothetical protein